MAKVRVNAFTVSIDGYGAGLHQSLEAPLGDGGEALHGWIVGTRTFQRMVGKDGGSTGADDHYVSSSFDNVGAWILGRNMFGPVRGPRPDENWKGWWGPNPPYHVPVFVLTHHARPSLEMEGGTVFHFVTEGPVAALRCAREAAREGDVRIGGGVSIIRQYLEAGQIDEMHLAVAPVLLGRGESLLGGLDMPAMGWRVTERAATEKALHVVMARAR